MQMHLHLDSNALALALASRCGKKNLPAFALALELILKYLHLTSAFELIYSNAFESIFSNAFDFFF